MKCRAVSAVAALSLLTLLWGGWGAAAQRKDETLTNSSIVKLVRAGFSDKAIVSIIGSRPARFDLAPEDLIVLKKGGVSEKVILAMISRGGGGAAADLGEDDWGDDELFGGGVGARPQPGRAGDPGEVNIFGSSGGSRGRTRQRGTNGSAEADSDVVGSASVRIIRPPSEAGGAGGGAKLERTPTLTNEAVMQLVEAGFSDGTIVRRIEQSPVEFDLSDANLAELRMRRVSEPVVAAMRSAMSGDAIPATKPRSGP